MLIYIGLIKVFVIKFVVLNTISKISNIIYILKYTKVFIYMMPIIKWVMYNENNNVSYK